MPPVLPPRCERRPTCKDLSSTAPPSQLRRDWASPDPFLRSRGVRYLQLGGDSWNRCHEGWLNIDMAFGNEGLKEGRVATDDKGAHNMVLRFDGRTRLPFRSQSVQMVYSEHMIEHLLPDDGGRAIVREAYRVLVPGGVLRIATPDLERYACGYMFGSAFRFGNGAFLKEHARRFAPMAVLGHGGPSDGTIVNNIFRNYGHQWVYDYAELERLAEDVGIPATAACRSDRARMGLPMPLQRAIRRAVAPKNTTVACWLDQEVREDESLYVHLTKMAEWPQPKLAPQSPKCQQPEGWLPCPADALAHTAGLLPS